MEVFIPIGPHIRTRRIERLFGSRLKVPDPTSGLLIGSYRRGDVMSDEPKKRSRAWIGWAPPAVAFIYAFSVVPSAVALRWLIHYKAVAGGGPASRGLAHFYAPVEWLARQNPHVYETINEIIRRLSP
jgi:hypothetical protein